MKGSTTTTPRKSLLAAFNIANGAGGGKVGVARSNSFDSTSVDIESQIIAAKKKSLDQQQQQQGSDAANGFAVVEAANGSSNGVGVSTGASLNSCLLLASAVVGLSSIGPILDLQVGVLPTMKILWRTTATALLLLPAVGTMVYKDGLPRLSPRQWICLFFTALFQSGMTVSYAWSLRYTTVGNAVILGNSHSIMLLLVRFVMGDPVPLAKATGAIVAFTGGVLSSEESSEDKKFGGDNTIYGDMFALSSAIFFLLYLILAKQVRHLMNIYVFMFFIMFFGAIQTFIFLTASGDPITFGFDRHDGFWGWARWEPDRLQLEIIMCIVCNCIGTAGYARSLCYFDTLVITTAALMEPVVAESLAAAVGVGVFPGWKGCLGNVLVAVGSFSVVYQPRSEKEI